MADLPLLDPSALLALAQQADVATPCPACAPLQHPGWDSLPSTFEPERLRPTATLREAEVDEPTLEEHHPHGTHQWSDDAPIAPSFHPYNRCEVWQCRRCTRAFLRYTEYGGYYEDERVRWLNPALITPI